MPPPAVRQTLRPIPYACGAQRALIRIAVGNMKINKLNINDVCESVTIRPRPCKLTFDLESGVRVTGDVSYLHANFGLPRPICSRVSPDVCDRQTDVRQKHRLMSPPRGQGVRIN